MKDSVHSMNKKNKLIAVQIFLVFLSLAAIIFGILREEHKTILQKAINICLECIGVG